MVKAYRIEVRISPREGLLDPEGKAVASALRSLEFDEVEEVRVGRLLRLRVLADGRDDAWESAAAMCRKLLANPTTEDYDIRVEEA